MKANELRIGNYVYDRSRKTLKVDRWENPTQIASRMFIDDMEVHPFTEYIDELKPIPLSEEWLLKFGFTGGLVFKDIEYFSLSKTNTGDDYYCVYFENEYAVDVKYVHQLQNLYFALTGEELTLKSE